MIRKIELINFRSHEHTTLEFTDGVNIITGDNDLGKSSVLRGINWVAFNKPSGNSFIKHGKTDCSVEIVTDNCSVRREKSKSKNCYNLYTGLGNNIYSAVGQSVPSEIKSALRIEDINIQNQHDKIFLISENSSFVSRYLNNLIGLDVIDSSLKNGNSEIRRLNAELKKEEDKLSSLKEDLKAFENIEYCEELYKQVVADNVILDTISNDCSKIENYISDLESLDFDNDLFLKLKEVEKDTIALSNLVSKLNNISSNYNNLYSIISLLETIDKSLSNLTIFTRMNSKVKKLDKIVEVFNSINHKMSSLASLLTSLNDIEKSINEITNKLDKLNNEFYTMFPEQCPLCGSMRQDCVELTY